MDSNARACRPMASSTRAGCRIAVAGHGHGVDRVDAAAGRAQLSHQQSAGGLNRHRDLLRGSVSGLGQHLQQLSEALDAVWNAAP
jgi:hypothetical protein